jgi:hypothetical protein
MTSPIDRIRRAVRLRGAPAAEAAAEPSAPFDPATAGEVPPAASVMGASPIDAAAFDAHLMGQHGEKRGLRGGKPAIDHAQSHYNRVEWSGAKDRRARKGRVADTEI